MLGVSTPRGGAYRPCVKIKSRWTQNPEPAVQTVKGEVDCYARWRLRKVETTLHGASLGSSRDGSVNSPRYSLYLDGSGSCMNRHDYRGPKGCRPSGLFVFELSHDNKGLIAPCSANRGNRYWVRRNALPITDELENISSAGASRLHEKFTITSHSQ